MYTSIASSYFIFLALSILTFIHSVTSLPIQTSTWVKIDQYEDPDSLGLWKVFEKEAQTSLPNPSHANQINSPTWLPQHHDTEATERGRSNYPYAKDVSSSGNPIVSVFTPKSLGANTNKLQKPYPQYMKQKSKPKSELEESSRNAIAADRQHRYDEILRYMHVKNAAHQEHSDAAPQSSAFSPSGRTITLFTHRFSIPTLKSQMAGLRGYPIPGVFTTVVILLVVVWIAIFTIGLVELCNYVWSRQSLATTRDPTCDDEGPSVELNELTKIPFSVVMVASEEAEPGSPSGEFGSLDVTSELSNTDSESDEDDFRML